MDLSTGAANPAQGVERRFRFIEQPRFWLTATPSVPGDPIQTRVQSSGEIADVSHAGLLTARPQHISCTIERMRHLGYRLVKFVWAAGFLPAGLAAFQPVTCDALSRQSMNLRGFQTAANAYSNLLSQPAAASQFLICIHKLNPELAETLMLYQRRLRLPAEVESAFLHYVINTREPSLADEDAAVLRRLERTYLESLFLADRPGPGGRPSATLLDLRRFGQKANASRYGRSDVVPVRLLDFSESSMGYSHLNAVWMAEMSALAYWDPGLISKQLDRWGYRLIAVITDAATDTSAFLAAKDNHLVLSFRGTSSLKNFITDVQVPKVPATWAEGNIHRGFAGALDTVLPKIISNLGVPGQQQKALWVTGHSLGAALAQLAALHLTKLHYRVQAVYTYGTPRVGDSVFAANYDKLLDNRTFPHINNKDVVTRVPPSSFGFRAAASRQVRKFTGIGHEMISLGETPDESEESGNWQNDVVAAIRATTEFLPAFLRPRSLRSAVPAGPAPMYSATFQQGALDEHGSFEYMFKLVCVAVEEDFWQIEARQANVPLERLRLHRDRLE